MAPIEEEETSSNTHPTKINKSEQREEHQEEVSITQLVRTVGKKKGSPMCLSKNNQFSLYNQADAEHSGKSLRPK